MNFLGGMIPGAIQGDEGRVVNSAEGGQDPLAAQSVVNLVIDRIEGLGRDRIEHLTDLVVARDLADDKEAGGVVLSSGLLQRLLMGQEGGGLGEEDREGAQPEIGHRVGEVLALAPIRQTGQDLAPAADQIVEAGSLHATSRWRKSTPNGLRKTSLIGPWAARPGALRPRPVVVPTQIHPAAR